MERITINIGHLSRRDQDAIESHAQTAGLTTEEAILDLIKVGLGGGHVFNNSNAQVGSLMQANTVKGNISFPR